MRFHKRVLHRDSLATDAANFCKIVWGGFGQEPVSLHQIRDFSKLLTVNATDFILVPILSLIMLNDGSSIRSGLMESFNDNPHARLIMHDGHELLVQYMRALLALCFATLVAYSIGLWVLHVPYSFVLALIAFPLEFLPIIGPIVSGAIILTVCAFSNAYFHGRNPVGVNTLLVFGFPAVYRLFQDYVLSPQIMRKSIELHPLSVLFGVLARADIDGIGGVFLSVPILALLHLIYRELRHGRLGRFDADPTVEVKIVSNEMDSRVISAS